MDVRHGIVATMLLLGPAPAIADCTARSPDHSVALLELYTSEGCDSCPPADRWLSRFGQSSGSNRVVPLALHVDYWDRLGWKDRFASATFTDRQREEMRRQHSSFVYTPQVLLQGRDFPQWHSGGDPSRAIAAINARPARATIELAAEPYRNDVRVDLRDSVHAAVAVVLVQSGLVSDVKAGENAGKRLAHDHVVRQWRAGPPLDANGEAGAQLTFSLPADPGPLTIVAFAENSANGEVLQALALPLCART
jgi:hypothetical protein